MRDRSVKQPDAPKGVDKRTWTKLATEKDRELAGRALHELETERLRIILVPAPDPHFDGHKIRVIESENPKWYQRFVSGRWDRRGCDVRRDRVIRALTRVYAHGRIRGNGYERKLMKELRELWLD
jgi:hypothetical protein